MREMDHVAQPAHVIIVAIGSAGDVHPFVGIGQNLLKRGHRVTLCTNPAFQSLAERFGLRFLRVGTEEAYARAMNDPALWEQKTSLRTLWYAIAGDMRPLFETLAAEVDDNTVLLGSLWAFSARMMQEKFGVPYISVQVSPSTLLSAHEPPVHPRFSIPNSVPVWAKSALIWGIERGIVDRTLGPALNELRRDLGLKPVQRIMGRWLHSPSGAIGLFPEWFARPQPDWPTQLRLAGFPLFDGSAGESLDDELQDFLDRGTAPVIITPGSSTLQGPAFFSAALQALRDTGRRGVLLGGATEGMTDLPPGIVARRYVPLSRLLPHGAALVHHGGIGTSALAFAAGVPQLVTPFAHDQFDNAARVDRTGAGICLRPLQPLSHMSSALRKLCDTPAYAERSRHWMAHTATADSARMQVVSALETLHAAQKSKRFNSPLDLPLPQEIHRALI
jgi:rhamnosyltransferase subunit B